ncbi:peptide/nickel transport system permease protein [Amycolatopsis lexingtonensis]|uniref:Peptide/nickel transport system permease protein n=1 Tax=Amycolatopsis lexingtonensis TaxID=218822 RepID=A0ABR9HVZ5_9PSEU|nr:ABC transporter permease [Amycolatopsis lexingtonensis]MBE1495104.1 peptide/nickel transport system permease protein [Amycolatopsis lexingtonensis]
MLRLIAHRLVVSVALVFVVSLAAFLLQSAAPGDLARAILGQNFSVEAYDQLRHQLGLDQPVLTQYGQWLRDALHGDLGTSPISGLSVADEIAHRLPVTLSLIGCATVVTAFVGVALGVVSAVHGGRIGRVVDVLSLIGYALPSFWFALTMVTLFAVTVRLLPATGYVSLGTSPAAWARSLVLPVATLALPGIAVFAKQTRDAMLDALSRDYVTALRAHGVPEVSVVLRHALRNAAIPVVTLVGLTFIGLLSGTVFVESVFAMPGLGGLAVQSTSLHDIRMIQGVVVVFTVIVVAVNLVVDLAYGWLNPKARVR